MLAKLAEKPELRGKVQTRCQDILQAPLDERVDLVVSAMAMHHVADTEQLIGALAAHLRPGGRIALADLDREDGSFHPPDAEGVYHHGFERDALRELLERHSFTDVAFTTAVELEREGDRFTVFLLTATRV
jgi:SAM-dependent methyltransferase